MAERKRQIDEVNMDLQPTTKKAKRGDWSKRIETRECVICAEDRPIYRNFPSFDVCDHEPLVCSTCITTQTGILLHEYHLAMDREICTCLYCDKKVPDDQFQNVLPRALVREMNELLSQAKLATEDDFRWCLAKDCSGGAIYDSTNPEIKCRKCKFKMCFDHQVPWHHGYTCAEYDRSHPDAAITQTSLQTIQETVQSCPNCSLSVEKWGGCNMMHCPRCHYAWAWQSRPVTAAPNHDPSANARPAMQQLPRLPWALQLPLPPPAPAPRATAPFFPPFPPWL